MSEPDPTKVDELLARESGGRKRLRAIWVSKGPWWGFNGISRLGLLADGSILIARRHQHLNGILRQRYKVTRTVPTRVDADARRLVVESGGRTARYVCRGRDEAADFAKDFARVR